MQRNAKQLILKIFLILFLVFPVVPTKNAHADLASANQMLTNLCAQFNNGIIDILNQWNGFVAAWENINLQVQELMARLQASGAFDVPLPDVSACIDPLLDPGAIGCNIPDLSVCGDPGLNFSCNFNIDLRNCLPNGNICNFDMTGLENYYNCMSGLINNAGCNIIPPGLLTGWDEFQACMTPQFEWEAWLESLNITEVITSLWEAYYQVEALINSLSNFATLFNMGVWTAFLSELDSLFTIICADSRYTISFNEFAGGGGGESAGAGGDGLSNNYVQCVQNCTNTYLSCVSRGKRVKRCLRKQKRCQRRC